MTTPTPEAETGGELRVNFTNIAPEDDEWSAHIRILNEWQNPERTLRDIVQYARSGGFYPADMHVDLLEQYIAAHTRRAVLLGKLEELQHLPAQSRCPDCHTPHDSVSWRPTITDRIKTLEAELKEIKL